MRIMVRAELEVNVAEDRCSANEVMAAVGVVTEELKSRLAGAVVEAYQERILQILCTPSGRVAKAGLGAHPVKGEPSRRCRYRTFTRAGHWSRTRALRSDVCTVELRPALIECRGCGKRFTPILAALELPSYQRHTDALLMKVTEAVADTSYRRGGTQLEALAGVPVPRSTAHRWAATVDLPVMTGSGAPYLAADGTGFKKQAGERGTVRLVLELTEEQGVRPLGVWAGQSWEEISRDVGRCIRAQPRLLVADGERGLEEWMGRLVGDVQRCTWHLARESSFALWKDGASLGRRIEVAGEMGRILGIELPQQDFELVAEEDKDALREQVADAREAIDNLISDFTTRGYGRAATYLTRAKTQMFQFVDVWLETGLVAPRTASFVECLIRELVRRLKRWAGTGLTAVRRGWVASS